MTAVEWIILGVLGAFGLMAAIFGALWIVTLPFRIIANIVKESKR